MTKEALGPDGLPGHDYFLDAVNHIDEAVANNTICSWGGPKELSLA